MKTIRTGAEYRLREALQSLHKQGQGWQARVFPLSHFKAEIAKELEKALGVFVAQRLAEKDGTLFFCEDKDIILLVRDADARDLKHLDEKAAALLPHAASSFAIAYPVGEDMSLDAFCAAKIKALQAARPAAAFKPAQVATIENEMFVQSLAKRAERAKPVIMLVEDDSSSMFMTRRALAQDFQTFSATSGAEALSAYRAHAPDIVFLDIGLPDADGHRVLTELRQLDPHAYIVMLSANSFRDDIVKSLKLGARGFVAKPFTRAKLLDYIDQWSKERPLLLTADF